MFKAVQTPDLAHLNKFSTKRFPRKFREISRKILLRVLSISVMDLFARRAETVDYFCEKNLPQRYEAKYSRAD